MPKQKTNLAKLPVIFIMDMDLTMVGYSNHYGSLKELVSFVRDCFKSKKIENLPCPKAQNYMDLITTEFVRPGLKDMITNIVKIYPTAEFFVYSAGAKLYVESLIPAVEKLLGISFNRPLFTRDDCITNETRGYSKSIMVHYDTMVRSLSSKYPALKDDANQQQVLKSRIVFVDDVDFVWDMKEKWIKCPEYTYSPVVDVTKYIDITTRKHPLVDKHIEQNGVFFKEPIADTCDERFMAYHMFMADWYRSQYKKNKIALEDTFCTDFVKAITPFKQLAHPFTDANIKKINAGLKTEIA
jgi:hypothetical protein